MRILLVEDDKDTAATIKEELEDEYVVDISFVGQEGQELAIINNYDVIIIDLILPDKNGIQVSHNIRKHGVKTPILMLTGEDVVNKKVEALDAGVDDYLTKPFQFAELRARIRALLRRHSINITNVLSVGDLTLDINKRIVSRGNSLISLRRKEIALLEYLMRNEGRVITRDMILDHVWDSDTESYHNTVDVHIKYLRDRVDRRFDKKLIKTVYGVGYKIEA